MTKTSGISGISKQDLGVNNVEIMYSTAHEVHGFNRSSPEPGHRSAIGYNTQRATVSGLGGMKRQSSSNMK
jgi:hypothetical protein